MSQTTIVDADTAAARSSAPRQSIGALLILSALMGFGSISTDVYLPALPAMAASLGAANGIMEFTITAYLLGFSVGQLMWGPIGDRHGRRIPVAVGIALFAIGSAGCALSGTAGEMIGWRVVQAVGACSGVVLARAMVRDLYAGDRAARMMSILMTVMAVAPLIGPSLGGQILTVASWHAIFWTLVGIGILTMMSLLALPETLSPERRNREPLVGAVLNYVHLLRQPRLMGFVAAGAFFYGAMFAYIAGSPFAYVVYHHVRAQLYGVLFGAGIVGIMAANMLNARLVLKFGSIALLRGGATGAALASTALAIFAWTGWGGLWGLAVPLFVFVAMAGFIVANSFAGALADYPENAGAVSALVGAMQYGTGILGSAMVGAFADGTPWTMAWVIALLSIGSAVCAWRFVSPAHTRSTEQ